MKKSLLFILFVLPLIVCGQIIRPAAAITDPNPGPYIAAQNGLQPFSNNAGTPSAIQWFNFSGQQLSTSVVFTITGAGGMEITKDTTTSWSQSLTFTGPPNISGRVYVRVAASTTAGGYTGNIHGVSSPATPLDIPYNANVIAVPTLVRNPTSLSGLTSTSGNLGGSQNYSLTGSALTGNITVGPLAGYQVSTNNINFFNSLTLTPVSGSISQTIYVALAASNSAGTYTGNLPNSGGSAATVNVAMSGTTTAGATTPDSVLIQFDTTNVDVAGCLIMKGDPSKRVITGTLAGTTISVSSVATATANWNPFCPSICYATEPNNGYLTGQTLPYAGKTGVMAECWYNTNAYQTTNPQIIVSGLIPGQTYDVEVSAGLAFAFNSCAQYNVKGAALQANSGFCSYQNTSNKVKWTSIATDGSGNFTFYFGHNNSGENMSSISYIRVVKH